MHKPITFRTFCAGFAAGALAVLLSSTIAQSRDKSGGIAGPSCPADIAPAGGDGVVNVDDLLMVINAWGVCATLPPCGSDQFEPNEDCKTYKTLATVGSDATVTYPSLALESPDAVDLYRINATETDSSCGCGAGLDEDYKLVVTLTVPADAPGPVEFCNGSSCAGVEQFCTLVQPGQSVSHTWTLDGACGPPTTDSYSLYTRIRAGIGGDCTPYQLSYFFDAGYCF